VGRRQSDPWSRGLGCCGRRPRGRFPSSAECDGHPGQGAPDVGLRMRSVLNFRALR